MKIKILLLGAIVAQAAQANVIDSEQELLDLYGSEELISIATGITQPVSKAPAVASVIDAAKIKQIGATDIDEVLETIPGLHVGRDFVGYNPLYTFRGIYADFNPQVLMLINGVPLTNLYQGDRNLIWGGMPVEAIDRIEVIRGPGSAIYGADAFSGVINIITKSGDTLDGFDVLLSHGSNKTTALSLSYGGSALGGELGLIVELKESDGQDEIIDMDAQSLLDLFTGTSVSMAPGQVNLERRTIDLRTDYQNGGFLIRLGYQGRRNIANGAGVAQALDPHNRFKSDRIMLDAEYTWDDVLIDNLSIKTFASYLDVTQEVQDDLVLFPPGSTGPFLDLLGQPIFGVFPDGIIGNPEVFERHYRLGSTLHYQGVDNHEVTLGLGYYLGDLYKVKEEKNFGIDPATGFPILPGSGLVDVSDTPLVFMEEDAREDSYIFVQDVIKIHNDWELTAGVRYDHYSDFGDTVNPRLALVWSVQHNLTAKLLYGEAFRAPSFTQTRAINNPAILGNPNLDPETLRSYEVAIDYHPSYDVGMAFNIFYYKWKDIIQFVPDMDGGTRTAQNAGEQTGYGAEFEVNWTVSENFELTGNYAWQNSTDEITDSDAANSPGQQLYLMANWEYLPDWSLNLQANWVMDRDRAVTDARPQIDDYVLVDLKLAKKKIYGNLEAGIIVKNLFDEDAREPSPNGEPLPAIPYDLPLAGRAVYGEVRYHF